MFTFVLNRQCGCVGCLKCHAGNFHNGSTNALYCAQVFFFVNHSSFQCVIMRIE